MNISKNLKIVWNESCQSWGVWVFSRRAVRNGRNGWAFVRLPNHKA
jgi:hypothetical protein